jgi:hypothetical protein
MSTTATATTITTRPVPTFAMTVKYAAPMAGSYPAQRKLHGAIGCPPPTERPEAAGGAYAPDTAPSRRMASVACAPAAPPIHTRPDQGREREVSDSASLPSADEGRRVRATQAKCPRDATNVRGRGTEGGEPSARWARYPSRRLSALLATGPPSAPPTQGER